MANLLARRFRVDILTGGTIATSPVWTQLLGITALTPTVSNPTMQDTSSYDTNGWSSSEKTMQGWSLAVTANIVKDDEDGLRDPAQEKIRAASIAFGAANRVYVRWYDRDGEPEAYQGKATCQYAPAGGDPSALDSVVFTLTGDGALTPITNPAD